jgi:hypothetical protein
MTLATQTWRVSAKYPVTVAGASITYDEMLQGIKDMLDGEDALGNNYWTYASGSYLNGVVKTMIFKRKGSPSGVLATFRAGLFQTNSAPSTTNRLSTDFTVSANILYCTTSEDHNSDSLANSMATGAVFSGKMSKMTSAPFTQTTGLASTSGVKCFMVECDTMCSIWFVSSISTNCAMHFTFGEIAERVESANGIWGYISSSGAFTVAMTGIESTNNAIVPPMGYATATIAAGAYYCNLAGSERPWGRLNNIHYVAGLEDATQNYNNTAAVMLPLIMSSKLTGGASQPQYTVGTLRQMRFGPRIIGQQIVKDTGGTVKGYAITNGYNLTSRALYFDNNP